MSDDDHYKKKYGSFGGNPAGRPPNFKLCCVEVFPSGRGEIWHQCTKKREYGPNSAYCKINSPDYVAEKRKRENEAYREKINQERYRWYGKEFFNALETIANGHNDPRSLAIEVIKKFRDGETK